MKRFAWACAVMALLSFHAAAQGPRDPWWKHAVIEEIYPRSYQDSNGDGVGDLRGIEQRLGYLESLGVDAIWIAPIYPSPQVDFGYDISDYEGIDPQYGTLADFDRLKRSAARHKIRIILDMVLNHTSDRHRWFVESSSSRTNAKADWYVWNDGVPADAPGVGDFQRRNTQRSSRGAIVPPNNWESEFGGSAWEWSPVRQQFYYHRFYKQQPDLNWRNPAVEAAMFGTMRFWLDRGAAGFRLDAITTLFEDPQLRNEGELNGLSKHGDVKLDDSKTNNLPEVHELLRRMHTMAAKYPGNRVLIGETYLPNTRELDKWYGGEKKDELDLPMDMLVGFGGTKLDASLFRQRLQEMSTQLHGSQPLIVFDNHDHARSIDRYGDGLHDVERAKLVAAILFTARATAMTYYGAEIGMRTQTPFRREDVKDPIGIRGWPREKGRDGERTPMQWDTTPQAGFSTNPHPWLPVAANAPTTNVATEERQVDSLLNWYKRLIALRRSESALRDGDMTMLPGTDPDVLAYSRDTTGQRIVVALNMSSEPKRLQLPAGAPGRIRLLAASAPDLALDPLDDKVTLPPFAVMVVDVPDVP